MHVPWLRQTSLRGTCRRSNLGKATQSPTQLTVQSREKSVHLHPTLDVIELHRPKSYRARVGAASLRFGCRLTIGADPGNFSINCRVLQQHHQLIILASNGFGDRCTELIRSIWLWNWQLQDSKTPAVVSLAAGGVAGGIEAFTSVCLAPLICYILLMSWQLKVSAWVCEDACPIERAERHADAA